MSADLQNKKTEQKHSVMISVDDNTNSIRISSTNDTAIHQIIEWYRRLTEENVSRCKQAKYTNAFMLESALKDNVFGIE